MIAPDLVYYADSGRVGAQDVKGKRVFIPRNTTWEEQSWR